MVCTTNRLRFQNGGLEKRDSDWEVDAISDPARQSCATLELRLVGLGIMTLHPDLKFSGFCRLKGIVLGGVSVLAGFSSGRMGH